MSQVAVPNTDDGRSVCCERDKLVRLFDVDLGERSAAERRARAMRRISALGEMTGGIAHDFKNILAIVDAGLRLAERHSREPAKVRACIAGAREGVDRGLRLTSQLLTFAKRQERDARTGDVNELLKNLELFLTYGAGAGIRIALELASDIPECVVDRSQFNAAVLNLVVNARDAMPNGGEIRISTARWDVTSAATGTPAPGLYVRVRVEDSGHGMPADVLRKVFDPVFTTKGEKGTGLGLPQVQASMRLIGGHVDIASEPGVGTTVDLLFPLAQPDGSLRPSPAAKLDLRRSSASIA
jgi:signal transduction histidine kinase